MAEEVTRRWCPQCGVAVSADWTRVKIHRNCPRCKNLVAFYDVFSKPTIPPERRSEMLRPIYIAIVACLIAMVVIALVGAIAVVPAAPTIARGRFCAGRSAVSPLKPIAAGFVAVSVARSAVVARTATSAQKPLIPTSDLNESVVPESSFRRNAWIGPDLREPATWLQSRIRVAAAHAASAPVPSIPPKMLRSSVTAICVGASANHRKVPSPTSRW